MRHNVAQSTTFLPFLYPSHLFARPLLLLPPILSSRKTTRRNYSALTAVTEQGENLDPEYTPYRPPSTFQDTRTLLLQSGAGGHGCISFLREKFVPHGPANGGDGGKGGDIYIQAVEGETSLHKLGRTGMIKAGRGDHGQGSGKNGKRGIDVVLKVPVGTIVRELERSEEGKVSSEYSEEDYIEESEFEEEAEAQLGEEENIPEDPYASETTPLRKKLMKKRPRRFAKQNVDDPTSMFIHYPLALAQNLSSPHFPPVSPPRSHILPQPPTHGYLDLTTPSKSPILLLRGSAGGLGNPHFITPALRRPKFATKGGPGSKMKISLELKLLADIGLVGRPNVGKSSLLRCLTASRARVGSWAFTTLVPNVGTVVLDRGLGMGDEDNRERFTIADIPGLIRDAGNDRGLGWDFLRHVERAKGLVYVVDLSDPDPIEELESVWADIRGYEKMRRETTDLEKAMNITWEHHTKPEFPKVPEEFDEKLSMSKKPWMVVCNKADVEGGREKFLKMKAYLEAMFERREIKQRVGCVAISALKAGQWGIGEYEKEEEVWKGVGGWLRGLVG